MKRWVWILLISLAPAGVVSAASPVGRVLRHDLEIQRGLQDEELAQLQRVQGDVGDLLSRISQATADFLHAQVGSEPVENLRRRDEDIRALEGRLMMVLLEMQQLRQSTIVREHLMARTRSELEKLRSGTESERDLISGSWDLVLEPGGQKGRMVLELEGTLIQGTYELDGGWTGSMRGTLVGGRIRLERIDSQMGFVAIFYGALRVHGDEVRLEGKWEATQLATGLPSAGGWVARRLDESGN